MATVIGRGETARKGSQAKGKTAAATNGTPTEEQIRMLAYSLYEQRRDAGIDGDPEADWIQAERELSSH